MQRRRHRSRIVRNGHRLQTLPGEQQHAAVLANFLKAASFAATSSVRKKCFTAPQARILSPRAPCSGTCRRPRTCRREARSASRRRTSLDAACHYQRFLRRAPRPTSKFAAPSDRATPRREQYSGQVSSAMSATC